MLEVESCMGAKGESLLTRLSGGMISDLEIRRTTMTCAHSATGNLYQGTRAKHVKTCQAGLHPTVILQPIYTSFLPPMMSCVCLA